MDLPSNIPPPLPPEQARLACVECGKLFAPDDVVRIKNATVCAHCKPVFLQRLTEGAPLEFNAFGLWREGKRLVARKDTAFPDRCIKCNAPASGYRLKRTVYWHHAAYYLLLLLLPFYCLGLVVFVITSMAVRKKMVFEVGLCEKHRRRRWVAVTACVGGTIIGLGMLVTSSFNDHVWLAMAGATSILVGVIWGVVSGRIVEATKMDDEQAWLRGAGPEYLNQLPQR